MAKTPTRDSRRSAAAATVKYVPSRAEEGMDAPAGVAPATKGFTLSVESDTVHVRHTGEINVQEIEASRRAVADLAIEKHLTRILLDLSGATSGLTPVDIFELCASQGFVLPPGATVAVVYRTGQFPAEDARFAEAITLNRGATLRAFTDRGAAQQWLSTK